MYGDTQNTGATRSQCSLDISTFRVSYKAMTIRKPIANLPLKGYGNRHKNLELMFSVSVVQSKAHKMLGSLSETI